MSGSKSPMQFVLPFFLDGEIVGMAVYSSLDRAQRALRRYVGFSELRAAEERKNPHLNQRELFRNAQNAIDHTRYAGSIVYEVRLDAGAPASTRRSKSVRD